MQVGPTPMRALADIYFFRMVVKAFRPVEVDFTREQHTCNQGVHPILVPIISPASQLGRRALSGF